MTDIKPLVLHAHATGPNPVKIGIALELLKLPYTLQFWTMSDDPEKGMKGAKFTKINENGRTPALEDPNTGVVAWESGAVMNYLRRAYDKENILGPKSTDEQARVDFEKWEYFLLTTLGPFSGQVSWFGHFHPTKNEDAMERYVQQTYRCYGVVEGQLKKTGGASILPGGLSAVDCHFLPWIKMHPFMGVSLDEYPNLKRWLNNMVELKEVKTAYDRIQTEGQAQ